MTNFIFHSAEPSEPERSALTACTRSLVPGITDKVLDFSEDCCVVLALACDKCRRVFLCDQPEQAVKSALDHVSVCGSQDIAILELLKQRACSCEAVRPGAQERDET
jgi:hypothetical protein